ncbi:hypothetical protein OPV22_032658 [Ensete ventricosum]|uniref:NAC domain-containing protein n=1 Tax=Ensete ventricosum TaxID=4639 RepID=A0AAV8PX79_ENSVE|nr:hypothetical protein OPV22_032658 [Ensete ventricosum]
MTSTAPPGYRFYPTEEELISFYLQNKLNNRREDMEWVIPMANEREANGGRQIRTTPSGYWKATSSPSLVYSSGNRAMGVKRTIVFYQGRAPACTKMKWKMNKYRALEEGATGVISSSATKGIITFVILRLMRILQV